MSGSLRLTLSPSSGLHSPPLLGTAAVPGLMAPIPNGFPGVLPFPGSHPALETVYANGLVPYPGNWESALEPRTVSRVGLVTEGHTWIPTALHPVHGRAEQGVAQAGVGAGNS